MEENKQIKREPMVGFFGRMFLKTYLFYLMYFARHKLKHFFLTRGEKDSPKCTDCGVCCKDCISWDENTKLCNIWEHTDYLCRQYPTSPLHLKLMRLEGVCKYYWKDKDVPTFEKIMTKIF